MFEWILSSSVLILIILAARALLREKISARVQYALWGLVLLRLLVPFSLFESGLSVLSAAQPVRQAVEAHVDEQMLYAIPTQVYPGKSYIGEEPVIDRTEITQYPGGREVTYYSGGVVIDRESTTHYFFMMPLGELLNLIRRAGTVLTACWLLCINLRFNSRLKQRRRPLEAPGCPLPVYEAEGLPSPCLFGLFRPAIYLTPEAAEDKVIRGHVLAHELTHYAHRDHVWAVLRCLCLALHWYNPLAWLAAALSKRDGELACDEGAVERLGEGERLSYGRTLVDMVAQGRGRPADLLSCSPTLTGGATAIRQRVERLVKHPETRKAALFLAVAAAALAAAFVFAGEERESGGTALSETYLIHVESAQAVRYGPPIYSSYAYVEPISDPDLLEQAKEILLRAKAPTAESEVLEDQEIRLHAHSAGLLAEADDQYGEYPIYSLYHRDGITHVFLSSGSEPETFIAVAALEGDAADRLSALAREQMERSTGDSVSLLVPEAAWRMEYVTGHAKAATLIQFYGGPVSGFLGPGITDADLLEQARAVLASGDPQDDTVKPGAVYDGAAISIRGEGGSRLKDYSVTNASICRALEELEREQLLRNTGSADSVPIPDWPASLQDGDIRAVVGGGDAAEITRLIRSASRKPLHWDGSQAFGQYDLWTLTLELADGSHVDLSAGLEESVVMIDGALYSSPPLHQLLRERRTPPADAVVQADLAPIRFDVDKILEDLLAEQNQWLDEFSGARYTGIRLTEFARLSSYPDLLEGKEVNLYLFDYGLSIDDLAKAGWAGGPWVDGNGLFHPGSHIFHLLTVEDGGRIEAWRTILWEFPLEVGGQGFDDLVTEDYVRDVVVNNLRDQLDPVVPASADTPEEAQLYGQSLARYLESLGPVT